MNGILVNFYIGIWNNIINYQLVPKISAINKYEHF